MPRFTVFLNTTLSVRVEVNAADEEEASDFARSRAEEFAQTIFRYGDDLTADATFDGVDDSVEEVTDRA